TRRSSDLRSEEATTITPDVPTSRRCTMPLRSGGPEVESLKPAAAKPPMTVGPSQPTEGCAATPTGLLTAMMSSSEYTTSIPSTSSSLGTSGAAGSGRVTSTHCPALKRSDLDTVLPLTSTAPSTHKSAVMVRDSPNILDKAASTRNPSIPSGTGRVRTSLFMFRPPFLSQHGNNKYNHTYRNRGVSNIEYGEVSHRN